MDAASLQITVANISNTIPDSQLQAVIVALGEQLVQDFQPEWGGSSSVVGTTTPMSALPALDSQTQAVIYLGSSTDDPTTGVEPALGYHFDNQTGVPYGFVYLDVVALNGGNWSVTLSHEVLELLGDPSSQQTVTGGPSVPGVPDPVQYDFELCDPVQADSYAKSNGTQVSNFVGRAYFNQPGGSGRTNFLGNPLLAFGVRPKSYLQYELPDRGVPIWGPDAQRTLLDTKVLRMLGQSRLSRHCRHRKPTAQLPLAGATPSNRGKAGPSTPSDPNEFS